MSKKENVSKNGAAPKYYLPMWQLVLLFCATLGFYWFYFIARTTRVLNDDLSRDRRSVKKETLKGLIPLYIPAEWAERSAERIDSVYRHLGKKSNLAKHALLLSLCPLAYCIVMQCRINKIEKEYFLLPDEEKEKLFADEVQRRKEEAERDAQAKADAELPPDPNAILEVRHVKKNFVLKKSMFGTVLSKLRAVDDVSFKIFPGETLGIVGESGCGKTTMGRSILKLYQPSGGQIFFKWKDIASYSPKEMRPLRKGMQIIFQDPYSSLPPRSTVGGILAEAVKVHNIVPKEQVKDYVLKVMESCGLRDYYYERYPHEFSGGQRQRICIARSLIVSPRLVVCDEPVSALDVSIQAQIINLLKDLQAERKLTYLFISHDLSIVKYISDKIGVMYLGSMVEFGKKDDIFNHPMHPYTEALFSAVPNPDPNEKGERIVLKGDIPSPSNPPYGCKFHTRCPHAMDVCKHIAPVYKEYEEGHFVACHLYPQSDTEDAKKS